MPLTQKAIDELKAIHKRQTGEDLSDDEAWEMGNRLIRLFRILVTPPGKTGDDESNVDGESSHVSSPSR